MTGQSYRVIEWFRRLKSWNRGGEKVPHKPLLALYTLGRLSVHGMAHAPPFREADGDLTTFMKGLEQRVVPGEEYLVGQGGLIFNVREVPDRHVSAAGVRASMHQWLIRMGASFVSYLPSR